MTAIGRRKLRYVAVLGAVALVAASQAAGAAGSRPVLTYRQIEVLTLVGRNMTTSQIARHLALSEPAVKKHLKGANERLGARSRREAVSIARELGLIPPG